MTPEFRNRVFLPIVLPLAVLLGMLALIGSVALVLLYNTHEGALMLAAVLAAGILFTVSLATSQDRLGSGRGAVIVLAAAIPLLVGAALGTGVIGDIADEDRNINVEPLMVVPDDAPVIAAESSVEFCLPAEEGQGCQPTDEWQVTPSQEAEGIVFVFENLEAGVPHNVRITELLETDGEPTPGGEILTTDDVTGIDSTVYSNPDMSWDELPEQWYFYCTFHPVMNGVGTVVGGEGGA